MLLVYLNYKIRSYTKSLIKYNIYKTSDNKNS